MAIAVNCKIWTIRATPEARKESAGMGQVRYASSIIASQVATLENISKRIDNKTKIHKPAKPAQSSQSTL
ncbi:hypothetical protein K402DRAFT_426098 [Aulographum hederae CBS 113979]|uniref:Uncharacterized protein n=1 Tax=Aulographum hederae CBS 113979 TaxID=1176131 RepID=A0A6G1GIP5_9PEZI|nr:hypothetical protein K402DRAFT_426098 [Aulographum hederae CBS 113979]